MITEADKKIIKKISEKYRVKRVLLFGSSLDPNRESHDIDIAVEGVSSKDFYNYYGELILSLSKPIDIIDMSKTSKFVQIIQRDGLLIHG